MVDDLLWWARALRQARVADLVRGVTTPIVNEKR